MLDGNLSQLLYIFPILLISVVIHEFAHCWMTYRLGDPTPKQEGRVTLNPLEHLDVVGTIVMAFSAFSGVGFGWGRPAPMNSMNFRNPSRDRMISAAAGPASNILQMFAWSGVGLLLMTFFGRSIPDAVYMLCWTGIWVNGFLAVFNMLPIFPLDGHHVLQFFAPPHWRPVLEHPAWYALFLAIIFVPFLRVPVFTFIVGPLADGLMSLNSLLVGWPM